MPGTTPINGLQYATQSDGPLGGLQMQNLAEAVDSKLVARFPNVAARDQAIRQPVQGMVCHIDAQTNPTVLPPRLMVFSENRWRLIGPSPLAALNAVGSIAAGGTFTNSPQPFGSYVVADPGFPYRLSVNVMLELGASAPGSRWDMFVRVAGTVSGDLDFNIATVETVHAQRIDSPIMDAIFTGATTVYLEARRGYGTGTGTWTNLNRRFQIARHAA